jgi:hypothetical protein
MRNFRRLSPHLRVVGAVGVALAIGAIVLFMVALAMMRASLFSTPVYASRLQLIALDLGLVAGVCAFAVKGSLYFRQPDRRSFPLDSWRRQMRALALLEVLPFAALTLAFFIPPTLAIYGPVFGLSIVALGSVPTAYFWLGPRIG